MLPARLPSPLSGPVRTRFLAAGRERLGKIEQPTADRRIVDRIIPLDQFDAFAPPQRIGVECLSRRLRKAGGGYRRRMHRIGIVIKEHYRHTQHAAEVMEPAGADAVRTALVFLDLLEGQAELVAELFL